MRYEKFIEELGAAGLNVREFAGLIGVRANSVSNNSKRGEVPPHYAVIVTLLAELRRHDISHEHVFRRLRASRSIPEGKPAQRKPERNSQVQLELGR